MADCWTAPPPRVFFRIYWNSASGLDWAKDCLMMDCSLLSHSIFFSFMTPMNWFTTIERRSVLDKYSDLDMPAFFRMFFSDL
jgi:hypothetical protein